MRSLLIVAVLLFVACESAVPGGGGVYVDAQGTEAGADGGADGSTDSDAAEGQDGALACDPVCCVKCAAYGDCWSAPGMMCVPKSNADCAGSKLCEEKGECWFDPDTGWCETSW